MRQGRDLRASEGHLKELYEVADEVVNRRAPAPDSGNPPVEQPDVRAAMVEICVLLGVETPATMPAVEWLSRADWARRSVKGALPTLRILEDLWLQDGPADMSAGPSIGRVFGPLVGDTAVDLAEWMLGDFDVQLPNPHDAGVLALSIENLVSLSESWTLPISSVAKWALACSLSSRLLLSPELMGDRLSRLALCYRVEMGAFFQSEVVSDLLGGAGPLDVDRLMAARTPKQQVLAVELSRLTSAFDWVGMLAWRVIDPDHTQALEDHLVEALRRRRADLPPSGFVAEFWLGVPLGPVLRPEVGEVVHGLEKSPAGLAALWLDPGLLESVNDRSAIAAAPVIPGKPRMVSLAGIARAEVQEDSTELRKLQARLEKALAGPLSPAQAEVVQGRLDGLSTAADLKTTEAIPLGSDGRRYGVITSWLQLWLIANGATLDKRLELASAVYAAVVASPQNGSLLMTRDETDLLRLHTRAIIQVERRNEYLDSGVELAFLAWLGSYASVVIGPQGLLSWQRTRKHRLQASGRGT